MLADVFSSILWKFFAVLAVVTMVLTLLGAVAVSELMGAEWAPIVDGVIEPEWYTLGRTYPMYEAGNSSKEVLGQTTAYCSSGTLFILVETDYPLDPDPEENWLRISGVARPVSPSDFAFLQEGFGWEGAFEVPSGVSVFVHISVQTAGGTIFLPGETRTAKTLVFPACPSTTVTLASFEATAQNDGIRIAWETASELDNVGFNLYRSITVEGSYTKLNSTLIPPQDPGGVMGGYYEWFDADVQPGSTYFYKLEDIDIFGVSTFHGPISAPVMGSPSAVLTRDFSGSPNWTPTLILAVAALFVVVGLWAFWRFVLRQK